ncbi:MAG: DUF1501 domain-containing protein [Armatimonadetes bacterium]|nr:DUF1501 domain-containing protein [Armatimonadota bacterium]
MLTIKGMGSGAFCDRVTRRQFLQIGGLACGGLSLTDLLAAEAQQGIKKSHKAVIMVYLPGGPAHQDTFDLKPDAPAELRGEFKPIKTNVPGIEICEHLPRMAKMMDKFIVLRSLVGGRDEHAFNICSTGYAEAETRLNHAPVMGSVVSRLQGPTNKTVPPYVNLSPRTQHMPYNDPGPGFLGLGYSALRPDGQMMQDMTLKEVSLDRLSDRRRMLAGLDRFRRNVDSLKGLDDLSQRAYDMLTSNRVVTALDLSKEDPKIKEMYGKGIATPVGDAAPMLNEQFLMARRLVEAGVRFVTVSYGFWDWHGGNFTNLKQHLPMLDQALSALVTDLYQRGLDKDVTVVVWGEMGRTPTINKDAGRDHWARVLCGLMSGGGMRTGQVIGATTRGAEEPADRPVHFREVFSTLYHNMGIDIANTPVPDALNRPNYLMDGFEPLQEVI